MLWDADVAVLQQRAGWARGRRRPGGYSSARRVSENFGTPDMW